MKKEELDAKDIYWVMIVPNASNLDRQVWKIIEPI